jgi:hypothetical protein
MAGLPRLAAGSYVLFLFSKSQAASANRKPVFFRPGARQDLREVGAVWMSGKKTCRKGDGFGEPNWLDRGKRNDQAMISGVI